MSYFPSKAEVLPTKSKSKDLRATVSTVGSSSNYGEDVPRIKEMRLAGFKRRPMPDTSTWLIVENVRICPARIIFNNVYTGSAEERAFSIHNEGKSKALLRISPPIVKDFEVDAIPNGVILKPGVKIVKSIRIPCVDASCLSCRIPFYINKERIDYEVIAYLATSKLTFEPSTINFGIIDQGVISAVRTLVLINDAHAVATFHIDMTKSKGHIVTEPNKGIVQGKSKFTVRVRVIPLYSGQLNNDLVIKCEKLISIPITATVIIPKLEAIHPRASKHFTLIYFSYTYFGAKAVQRLMIRNHSAFDCMFTTDGEHDDQNMRLEKYLEFNPDAQKFKISPLDGTMQPQETKIFWITFSPTYKTNAPKKLFFFCTIVVYKIKCKYLQHELLNMELYTKIPDTSYSYKGSMLSLTTLWSYSSHRSADYEASFLTAAEAQAYYKSQEFTEKDIIRVYLIGEAEIPSVKLVPDELYMDNLRMQSTEIRVVELQNASKNLPIIVRYRKIPFVSLEKGTINLKPLESKQITVTIVPYKLGKILMKMVFDLMYYDQPKEGQLKVIGSVSAKITLVVKSVTNHPKPQINRGLTPNYINEVGKHCQDLRFSSVFDNAKIITVEAKKHLDGNCNDLVALPNDVRRSLRPWRSSTPCCTIFTRQPRYIQPIDRDYERSQSEQNLRKRVITCYNKQIGSGQKKAKQPIPAMHALEDYTIDPQTKLLNTDVKRALTEIQANKVPMSPRFMPLMLEHMKCIIVVPECIQTGQIATNYTTTFSLCIENLNMFPVRLNIRSDKPNIGCLRGNRYILKANSRVTISLVYISGSIGYYAAVVYLIFNDTMIIPVPVLANVVPKMLRVNTANLEFCENCTHRYIELINNLNTSIKFYWVVEYMNFNVHPLDGTVEMGRILRCIVHYYPEIEGPTQCTIKLISGESVSHSITLTTTKFNPRLEIISKEVNFENMSLQKVSRLFPIIKNPCNFPIAYTIECTDLKPNWIKIFPMASTVQANCQYSLLITAMCSKCVIFQGSIKVIVVNSKQEFDLKIRGNVIYPDIRISPNIIDFHKVLPHTYIALKFTVSNHSPVHTHLKFAMENYDEFKITEGDNFWEASVKEPYIFKPKEQKAFYIHFSPKETMMTWFYLPIVIDEILGPPLRYDQITQFVDYYLAEDQNLIDGCQRISLPQRLPCLKVMAFSSEPKLVFSKMKIVLNCDVAERRKSYVLKIKNIQQITDTIYIRVHCLTNPFSYSIKETISTTIFVNVVKLILKPQEEAEMTIIYDSQAFGKSEGFLPIYLESDLAIKMYTTIRIVGIFQKPVIKLRKRYIEIIGAISGNVFHKAMINTNDDYGLYCRPLPEYTATFSLRLAEFLHHNTNCELSFKFDGDEDMKIAEGGDKIWIDGTTYKMSFKIINLPKKNRIYTGFYEVSCSCGGFWRRPVIGAYENSFLTTYAFSQMYLKQALTSVHRLPETSSCSVLSRTEEHAIREFWHLFPMFPTAPDLFTAFMEGCIHAVEMWVYTQGFFKETYYGIPKCINDIYTNEDKKKKQNTGCQQGDIPYVRLLNNLIGPQVNNYLGVGQFPSDKADQVKYTLSVFQKALDLVKELGGTLTYISPEFLLPFGFFDIFRKEYARETIVPRPLFQWTDTFEEYTLLAKQSWLDLLLQTYKVLYLSRLPTAKTENVTYCPPMGKFLNELPNLRLSHYHLYSKNEQVIIAWCQYHYDNLENNIWSGEQLPDKVVSVVGDCFQDGLVFAAITCAYCPYLIYRLRTMYPHPVTAEGYAHNIHSIIESWEMLNYSFTITYDDILKPNSLRMLMLIAYLYDVLPSMYPNDTIVFKASLSLSVTKSLTLSNPNDYPIAYKAIIIPENYMFKTNQEEVIISPKKNVEIQVIYFAKFAREFSCTLLLSGEVRGHHYAKNKCLTLIGKPDLTYPSTVITYPAYHYEISELDLVIQSPYVAIGSYELRQTVDVLHSYEQLETTKMYTNKTRFNDDRVIITNNIFISNSEGVIHIEGIIRTIKVRDTSSFLYFSNRQLGDFMVRIDTKWYDTYKSEDVFVTLPMEFCENPIVYSDRSRLTINIPLSNNILWDTVKAMTNKLVEDEDKPAWKSLLDMPSGRLIATHLYHMHRLFIPSVGNNQEGALIYTLTTDKDCNINLPSEIAIRSEYEEGTVEIEWTLKPPCRIPTNFVMTLRNTKFSILRRYSIIFRYENRKRI